MNYREAYGIYACNGILFNHESPIRGETFVTRKITRAVARIALGLEDQVYLGNLNALRDWGHAKDYVRAQWLILQQAAPEDYVIATGEQHSVREFCDKAFACIGIKLRWEGTGIDEKGVIEDIAVPETLSALPVKHVLSSLGKGRVLVSVDPRYFRPTEVETLLGGSVQSQK